MIYVVGSGPTGMSCAYALVKKGLKVTMLDAGLDLEPERKRVLEKLKSSSPKEWDDSSLNTLKENSSSNVHGIPLKLVYGSAFPYIDTDRWIPFEAKGAKIQASLAKGGLSNVWGAAVLPYADRDIIDWPISVADLAPHYASVLSFMNLSAVKDDLESLFPLYCDTYQPLRPSRQAKALMEDLQQNKDALRAEGLLFGYSRLAVRSHPSQNDFGCAYCGLCLYGCPYELIYNASHTLSELQFYDNFHYVKDVIVQTVKEHGKKIIVSAVSRPNGEPLHFEGSHVYLACGVLPTTKILLESLNAYDHPVIMKDSQWFLLPLLRYKKIPNVTHEDLHTLSQIFIELVDPQLSNNIMHLQVYTYNDLYSLAIKKMLGRLHRLLKIPIGELLNRLIVIQGYLHSSVSSTISIKLTDHKDQRSLVLQAKPNMFVRRIIKGIITKLCKNKKYLLAVPIPWLLQVGLPGSGNHIGGTFPMKEQPTNFESDCFGRPYGLQNIHIVDASAFPSIPATSITLTAMANAHRIASLHGEVYGRNHD